MDFSSFITSLLTSFVIFVVLILIFAWLSTKPGNAVIYYPNRILRGLEPVEGSSRSRNPFAWIAEAIKASKDDVITAAGLDAYTYLQFLATVLGILVFSGIVLLPVLLPVAGTDHGADSVSNSNGTFTDLDKFAIGNVKSGSPRFWAFVLGVYLVSFVTFCMLWKGYKHISDLRASELLRQGVKPEQYTVLVRDIPPAPSGQTIHQHVELYFKELHGHAFYRAMVITDNKEVNKIWEELEGYKKKLNRAEAVYAESKTTSKPEGVKPTHRIGFLGLVGEKVDTIDYCKEKIKELMPKLEAEQKTTSTEKQQAAALAFFNSRTAAVSAAQTLHAQMVDTWSTMEAPEPRDLIWTNLPMKFYAREIRSFIIYVIVFLTIFFYMIPIIFVSAFTTIENLEKYLPFMKAVVEIPAIKTILEAFLPQLALIVFLALLPMLLMLLSKAEGIPSVSHATRAASGKYFYFVVLNVFIGVTIGGALFDSMKDIIKKPSNLPNLLGKSLPPNATYFMTFVALKFFVGYGLELSRLVPLIIFHIKKKYLCKTEDEVKQAWEPSDIGYATKVPNDMLIMTISLCYSVIAPIIIPFGALYFGLGWLILRNQALKVYVPKYESYGRMWPHMQARVVAALVIFQITMVVYIMVLKKFYYGGLLVPPIIFSFIFAYACKKKFHLSFSNTPLEVVARDKEIQNVESIYEAYIPPSLNTEKYGDIEAFQDAQSLSIRATSFS